MALPTSDGLLLYIMRSPIPTKSQTTALCTMDRAIRIPLQGALREQEKTMKKTNGELRKLGYLVGFCLLFELFLAFPVVYLLGAHFREQQEAVLGREPTMERYSALSTAAPSARKPRSMIHLQAKIPEDKSCPEFPILHWAEDKLEMFKYANGVLEVPEEGDYFVYSSVTFEGCGEEEECKTALKNCNDLHLTHVKQTISRGTKSYGSSAPRGILSGSRTVIAQSSESKPWRKSIYLGAVFHLKEGDRLMVNVSAIELVREMGTFFGLASLN